METGILGTLDASLATASPIKEGRCGLRCLCATCWSPPPIDTEEPPAGASDKSGGPSRLASTPSPSVFSGGEKQRENLSWANSVLDLCGQREVHSGWCLSVFIFCSINHAERVVFRQGRGAGGGDLNSLCITSEHHQTNRAHIGAFDDGNVCAQSLRPKNMEGCWKSVICTYIHCDQMV